MSEKEEPKYLEMCSCGSPKPPADLATMKRATLQNGAGEVAVYFDDHIIILISVREVDGQHQRSSQTVLHRRHLGEVMRIAAGSWAEWSAVGPHLDIYCDQSVEVPSDQEE